MEKTKIYVLLYTTASFNSRCSVLGFTLSKEDAEYYVFKKNEGQWSASKCSYGFDIGYYSFKEATALSLDKDSNYKKFIKTKIEELQKGINSKKECASEDEVAVKELEAELAYYQSK